MVSINSFIAPLELQTTSWQYWDDSETHSKRMIKVFTVPYLCGQVQSLQPDLLWHIALMMALWQQLWCRDIGTSQCRGFRSFSKMRWTTHHRPRSPGENEKISVSLFTTSYIQWNKHLAKPTAPQPLHGDHDQKIMLWEHLNNHIEQSCVITNRQHSFQCLEGACSLQCQFT